jgi:hypothetical protein|nr:MAG TPA: hypothetical protein [Caudoviricetes sp.]
MNRNYKFYAICDESGINSVTHLEYENLKAIFSDKKEAEQCLNKALDKYPHIKFELCEVNIVDATK